MNEQVAETMEHMLECKKKTLGGVTGSETLMSEN